MKPYLGPLALFLVGLCLLLIQLDLLPTGRVLWTGSLLLAGLYVFFTQGFNKSSFVAGALLTCLAAFSLIRYATQLKFELEFPIILMVLGGLLALNKTKLIPEAPAS